MTPKQRARRIAAVLAVPAFLLSACGSGDSEDSGNTGATGEETEATDREAEATCQPPAEAAPEATESESGSPTQDGGAPLSEVSGEAGERPEISVSKDAEVAEEMVSEVLTEGGGEEISQGDFLRLDILARTVQGEMELLNTWSEEAQAGEADGEQLRKQIVSQAGMNSYLPASVTEAFVGQPAGTRMLVEGRASEVFGEEAAQQSGFSETEGVVWVIDAVGTAGVNPLGQIEGRQAASTEGLPEVRSCDRAPALITMPEDADPPQELKEQVLIEGEGPEVRAGQVVAVQYTGVTWAEGQKFDSSWDRSSAAGFQIGTGSVVQGWDEGLVGKRVGDRVLLVVPPDMGYGEEERENIPAGSTLVFVVDILGAA